MRPVRKAYFRARRERTPEKMVSDTIFPEGMASDTASPLKNGV